MVWLACVQIGELTTLSVVVLVSFLAQPHLQSAMARDGLLPALFAQETNGVLRWNLLVTGSVLTGEDMHDRTQHLSAEPRYSWEARARRPCYVCFQ